MNEKNVNQILDIETAEAVARGFSTAFTNFGLYGQNHPLTVQSVESLLSAMGGILSRNRSFTIHINQNIMYCEEHRIDPRISGRRLVSRISDTGAQSVAFSAGLEVAEISEFAAMLNDSKKYPSVDAMTAALAASGFRHIRFNTVRYQKVSDGQVVVDSSIGNIAMAIAPAGDAETGREMLKRIASTASESADRISGTVSERIVNMRNIISNRAGNTKASSEDVITALSAINSEILHSLRSERASGSIMNAGEAVVSQVEQLTFDAIIRIVKEEFLRGEMTAGGLARIIRRLIPGVADLKRLLPSLKKSLTESGLSESDYLKLMEELAGELENEGITDILRETGAAAGISVKDILDDIRKNPETAVNLILLSDEIRRKTGLDEGQIHALMGEYLERMTSELIIEKNSGERARNFAAISLALEQVRDAMTSIAASRGLGTGAIAEMGVRMAAVMEEESRRETRKQSGVYGAEKTGEKKPDTESVGSAKNDNSAPVQLPAGVLGLKGMKIFLDREIKRYKRYGSTLSCLCISAIMLKAKKMPAKPPADVLEIILKRICALLNKTLRDLDLISSLGALEDNLLLVLLTMTNGEGAEVVKQRLSAKFADMAVERDGTVFCPVVVISALEYDGKTFPDVNVYLKSVTELHRKNIVGTAEQK
jgi:hypothetical protein